MLCGVDSSGKTGISGIAPPSLRAARGPKFSFMDEVNVALDLRPWVLRKAVCPGNAHRECRLTRRGRWDVPPQQPIRFILVSDVLNQQRHLKLVPHIVVGGNGELDGNRLPLWFVCRGCLELN